MSYWLQIFRYGQAGNRFLSRMWLLKKLVDLKDSQATVEKLDPEMGYFPMISITSDHAFYGLPPPSLRPTQRPGTPAKSKSISSRYTSSSSPFANQARESHSAYIARSFGNLYDADDDDNDGFVDVAMDDAPEPSQSATLTSSSTNASLRSEKPNTKEVERLTKELDKLKSKCQNATTENQKLEAKISRLKPVETELGALRVQRDYENKAFKDVQTQRDTLRKKYNEVSRKASELDIVTNDLEKVRAELKTAKAELAESQTQLRSLNESVRTLNEQLYTSSSTRTDLENQLRDAKESCGEKTRNLERAQAQVTELEEAVGTVKTLRQKTLHELLMSQNEVQKLSENVQQLQEELETLNVTIEELEGVIENLTPAQKLELNTEASNESLQKLQTKLAVSERKTTY
ncbi:hypothetical protein G7Y89_g2034 [Cudoniella acicularis]|uniref:Uncharacterized protein n=1 Tax=Cudoniella acicularis TaxID=354080 RepID=A0A8H4RV82_9HELO|nr:hypothetical protein G7Y89_g2034 [Cudoniella acicularis]